MFGNKILLIMATIFCVHKFLKKDGNMTTLEKNCSTHYATMHVNVYKKHPENIVTWQILKKNQVQKQQI